MRGRGGIFCAGRELRDLRALQDASNDTIVATYEKLKALNEAVWFCPLPTVALIEKYAFGAGATLSSWCDIASVRGNGAVRLSRGPSRLPALAGADGAVLGRRPQEGDGAGADRPAHRRARGRPHRPDHAGRAARRRSRPNSTSCWPACCAAGRMPSARTRHSSGTATRPAIAPLDGDRAVDLDQPGARQPAGPRKASPPSSTSRVPRSGDAQRLRKRAGGKNESTHELSNT